MDRNARQRTESDTAGNAETVIAVELLEGLSDHAVFGLDSGGDIVTWPSSAERLYGHDPAAVLGETLQVLFADREEAGAADTLLARTGSETAAGEYWHCRAERSEFLAAVTVSPLRDQEGYAVVTRDATEEHQYREMLERQNDRLKEFTDIIAHDLRSPLQTIEGRLELYGETGDDSHVAAVQETTGRMRRLVDDLLEVARQGHSVTDPERTDLRAIVEAAWEGTGGHSAGTTLQYDPVPPVNGDSDRLHQVFENLFRNAVEHGTERPGSGVTVRVGPMERGFYVEDDGPGIPPDVVDTVFDHGVTTADDGTGYGLSVVRTITNAHGWDVLATEGSNGGARIEVTGVTFVD